MTQISEIFFAPPMACARLGASPAPLECFEWADDPSAYGAGRTVILPDITLDVTEDGSVLPYLPSNIRFKDGALMRPVAPFFELWANVADEENPQQPLTRKLLEDAGGTLDGVSYSISVANLKAARRTGDAACSFIAQAEFNGNDHVPRTLWASSPHNPGVQPLVFPDRPIALGQFQVIRPAAPTRLSPEESLSPMEMGVDLGVLRVRFTPAKGEVYGPPETVWGYAPTTRRAHVIVKPENRILNPEAAWMCYNADYKHFKNPEPFDTYDGADVNPNALNRSWGVVDDTCDGIISASVVIHGRRFTATARVFSGPPDFAPDRRPFLSLADDLADRDLPLSDNVDGQAAQNMIADLFCRSLETSGLCNIDSNRGFALFINTQLMKVSGASRSLPATNQDSMTDKDKPFYGQNPGSGNLPAKKTPIPLTDLVKSKHEPLAQVDALIAFIREQPDRIKRLIRPPYARFSEYKSKPQSAKDHRDPRIPRDAAHDMRMPPYMRDSDGTALSLTWRQYRQLMDFVGHVLETAEPAATPGGPPAIDNTYSETPARRRARRLWEKRTQSEHIADYPLKPPEPGSPQ
jgi:hypothetical protein